MSKLLKSAMLAAGLAACAAVPSASAGGGYYGVGYGGCCGVRYIGYHPHDHYSYGYTSCCYERRYRRVYADPYDSGYYPRHVYYDPYPYIAHYGGDSDAGGFGRGAWGFLLLRGLVSQFPALSRLLSQRGPCRFGIFLGADIVRPPPL